MTGLRIIRSEEITAEDMEWLTAAAAKLTGVG